MRAFNHRSMSAPTLVAAAAQAAGGQQYPTGCLYVLATPIGNLADLSFRGLHVLALADAVACEDTRVSAQLLAHYGLHKPLLALHAHNEREAAAAVLQRLRDGQRVVLVSDAGTPAISDPGARLVQQLQRDGLRAIPIPGACSAAAALSVAGDAEAQGFRFVGFLPPKGEARKARLAELPGRDHTQLLFEAPHRVAQLVAELAQLAPTQTLTMARELSKQFEQLVTLPAADWPARLQQLEQDGGLRGEFVWLLHAAPPAAAEGLPAEAERALALLLPLLPLKQAVQLAAELSGAPRNALYERALALKNAAG
jgi:16S rRNA (cytidine1402-2'-O)-methyltransferase